MLVSQHGAHTLASRNATVKNRLSSANRVILRSVAIEGSLSIHGSFNSLGAKAILRFAQDDAGQIAMPRPRDQSDSLFAALSAATL